MTNTQQPTKFFATELRYLGKGTIETRNADGTLVVNIVGMGRVRIASDMVFQTKREALTFSTVPQQAGWSDAAKLSQVAA